MFYAERLGDTQAGEPYIAERGVFFSYEEFIPYRILGWSGTDETNTKTDALLDASSPAWRDEAPAVRNDERKDIDVSSSE